MTDDDALEVLTAVFAGTVHPVIAPVGAFANLPLEVAAKAGDGWTDPDPLVTAHLADADELGLLEVYWLGVETGHAWCPCDACGEPVLLPHGSNGSTPGGKVSTAQVAPKACRMSWTRNRDGVVVRCPGKHRPVGS